MQGETKTHLREFQERLSQRLRKASGTSRAAGQTIQLANAAATAGNTRDAAGLSGLSVTTSSLGSC